MTCTLTKVFIFTTDLSGLSVRLCGVGGGGLGWID